MGISAYSKTAWSNGVAPAINATNLNKIEDRLYDLTEEIITPTMASTTTVTSEITSLSSTTLKGNMNSKLIGNSQTPFDEYTKVLMHFEGTDASTTFTDQTGKTVTASGNAQIDTAQYRYGSASGLFDGTGDYLTVTDANNELDIGTQDFTIEFWARFNAIGATRYLIDFRQTLTADIAPSIYIHSTNTIRYQTATTARLVSTTVLTTGKWYHIAVSRSGGTSRLFINGCQEGGTYADTNNFIAVTSIGIAKLVASTVSGHNGWIDELRISVGIGRYTSNFTPLPYTNLSTQNTTLKIIGKNLFDSNIEMGAISLTTGLNSASTTIARTQNFLKVKPSTAYYFKSATSVPSYNYFIYDSFKNFISQTTVSTDVSFTTPSNASYLRLASADFLDETKVSKYQLEANTTSTTYSAYTETSAYLPTTLRKISTTVFDSFDCSTGKLTKETNEVILAGASITALTTGTNIDYVTIPLSTFTGVKTQTVSAIDGSFLIQIPSEKKLTEVASTLDSVGNEYKFETNATNLLIAFPLGTYANLASAQSGLSGTDIIYELEIPQTINYYPNTITSEPSGTMIVYPFVADYDFYDTGVGISNTSLPIEYLEYVNVVNKTTGALTPIDLSTCTVSANGLSFTSTAISAKDLVDFGYTYKDISTVPTLEYQAVDDLKSTVDGNTNAIRDLDVKIEQSNKINVLTLEEIKRDTRILKIMGGI